MDRILRYKNIPLHTFYISMVLAKDRLALLLTEATQKYFVSLEIQEICSPMWKTGRFDRFLGVSRQILET